jgi:hypothetical protein
MSTAATSRASVFIPFVRGSAGGDALYRDFQVRIASGDNVLLANRRSKNSSM